MRIPLLLALSLTIVGCSEEERAPSVNSEVDKPDFDAPKPSDTGTPDEDDASEDAADDASDDAADDAGDADEETSGA